ncbi:methylcytosine dioxygenase TET3-like [Manduca sexta]|uniref:methylcytosine dioxygenase TET3-like n=1 Tax=Manduca sexta TaxID=7130 RepID=UPI00188E3924|nr:methylcytosine dioxygenase TET3-like [Manduca sexta]
MAAFWRQCESVFEKLDTAILIALVIVNYGSGVAAHDDTKADQLAEESKLRAVTIIEPKYVNPKPNATATNATVPQTKTIKPEQRPPSKPPITPDKLGKQIYYMDIPRPYYGHIQKIPPPRHYPKPPLKLHHSPNSVYKFPRVIPLPPHLQKRYYINRPMVFAASNAKATVAKSPKFSLPVQTINGIRTDFVRPPNYYNMTTTTTTTTSTEATTTTKVLRTKRIWPKRVIENDNTTLHNTTVTSNTTNINNTLDETDHNTLESVKRVRFVHRNTTKTTTTSAPSLTTRSYHPVTRKSKIKSTTTPTLNFTAIGPNDWVPMVPSHFPKLHKPVPTPIAKRSDIVENGVTPAGKQTLYLQSFGLVPVPPSAAPAMTRKKMVFFKRKRQLNPYYSGYSPNPVRTPTPYLYGDLQTDGSHSRPKVVTKIKHHHHHHHHRYIKTVEKPVKIPYKVEVPKPYPVPVEKKVPVPVEKIKVVEKPVPYPVTVEKKVPYPIGIKVPHPVPVKVVEKEYVPKPYPIVHHVPVIKHIQVKVPHPVPVPVEKKVPYPAGTGASSSRQKVPYPVPVKVLVPQPYPVETKVPYPVQVKVKEPVEVIRHVHVKVPVPQPYPVKVPHPVPVPVEKRVPYPVEVEKKVPVPVQVLVPQKVEVEKRVPVYVPRPYPVEKRIPVPVKVPYPVKVPVKVPVQVPIEVPVYIHHPYQIYNDDQYVSNIVSSTDHVTSSPHHTVTVHGNTGFTGFQSRSDKPDTTTVGTKS